MMTKEQFMENVKAYAIEQRGQQCRGKYHLAHVYDMSQHDPELGALMLTYIDEMNAKFDAILNYCSSKLETSR